MARIDNLNNFLTDVATAIKDKTGKTDAITPANFDTEIASIETGGGGSTITKGLVINACDENGYVTEASIVGFPYYIPSYYCYSMFSSLNGAGNDYSAFNTNTKLRLCSVNSINKYAFNKCDMLQDIILPNSLTKLGKNAFTGCKRLTLTSLPNSINTIEESVFKNCEKLALTSLPNSLTTLGKNAFYGCNSLVTIDIPSGITVLNELVFAYCKSLERVNILGDVTVFPTSASAFTSSDKLSCVVMPNVTTVPPIYSNEFYDTPIRSGTGYVYVPDDLVDTYKSATNWSAIADQIKPISELEVE